MSHPSPQKAEVDEPSDEGNSIEDLDAVIFAFLKANPKPTDEQLHKVSELLGYPYEVFEERVFELFGEQLQDLDVEDAGELADEDPLSTFLMSFFMLNPEPSEEQIHSLAELAGVTPEELEQKVYALLALLDEGDNEEDQDEGEDEEADEDLDEEYNEEDAQDLEDSESETTDPETETDTEEE